jgi:hypothetical protein
MRARILAAVMVVAWSASLPLFPQAARPTEEDIQQTRAALQAKRQELVANAIDLTEEEDRAFWPLYREWRNEMALVGDQRIQIIERINDQAFDQMTDDRAAGLVEEWLSIQMVTVKLQSRYVKRFRKVLPGRKVARFFQLENKLDAITDYDLVSRVPLIE